MPCPTYQLSLKNLPSYNYCCLSAVHRQFQLLSVAVWFDQDSHATSDLFMFALNLKSFLKEHAIVLKTKEIIHFIARTNP